MSYYYDKRMQSNKAQKSRYAGALPGGRAPAVPRVRAGVGRAASAQAGPKLEGKIAGCDCSKGPQ
jgi:hypothetical protein